MQLEVLASTRALFTANPSVSNATKLVQELINSGDFEAATRLAREQMASSIRTFGRNHDGTIHIANKLGESIALNVNSSKRDLREAEALLEDTLKRAARMSLARGSYVSSSRRHLGDVRTRLGSGDYR